MSADGSERLPRMLSGRRRRLLRQLVAIGLAQATAAVATVLLVRLTFDLFLGTDEVAPEARLPTIAGALSGVTLLDAWLRKHERVRAEMLGQDYVLEVRGKLFEHLMNVAPDALRNLSRGGMLLRFVHDLTPLRQWLSLGVARILVASVVLSAGLIALAYLSPGLALGVLAAVVLGAWVAFNQGKRLQQATRDVRRLRSHLATNVSEKLGAAAVVQVHGQARREGRRLERQGRRLFEAMVRRACSIGAVRGIVQGTAGLANLGVLVLGVHLVVAGGTTPGVVVAALTLVGILVPPLHDLASIYEYGVAARISRENLQRFLSLPAVRSAGATRRRRSRGRGTLRFDHVSLAGVLEDFSAVAEAGRVTAIVGPNGAGKSSLLALAAGLIEPDRGRVLLDGKDVAHIRARDLRRVVGMAGHDLPLLRGTIRRNLCYRSPRAPREELERVSVLCGVDEIVAGLPDGLETRIGEGGLGLSIGQRSRLGLARALVGAPDILLLDQIDANLDAGSRSAVDRVLAEYSGTVLLATHDAELASRADAIWRLEGGRLGEAPLDPSLPAP